MIKTDTAIGLPLTMDDARHIAEPRSSKSDRRASDADVVEISDECKKRLVMSNLKAALSSTDEVKGRYNR